MYVHGYGGHKAVRGALTSVSVQHFFYTNAVSILNSEHCSKGLGLLEWT